MSDSIQPRNHQARGLETYPGDQCSSRILFVDSGKPDPANLVTADVFLLIATTRRTIRSVSCPPVCARRPRAARRNGGVPQFHLQRAVAGPVERRVVAGILVLVAPDAADLAAATTPQAEASDPAIEVETATANRGKNSEKATETGSDAGRPHPTVTTKWIEMPHLHRHLRTLDPISTVRLARIHTPSCLLLRTRLVRANGTVTRKG